MTEVTEPIVTRRLPRPRPTRRWLALIAAATVAAPVLLVGSAQATPASTVCRSAGHSASSAQILARLEATGATISDEVSRLRTESDQATTASPAAFRLREELGRLEKEAMGLEQLHNAAVTRVDATPGSPAQFRAQEEMDALCDQVGQ